MLEADEEEGNIDEEENGHDESNSWFSCTQETLSSDEYSLSGASCLTSVVQLFEADADRPLLEGINYRLGNEHFKPNKENKGTTYL